MLNALWIPLTVQDTALMAIAVPATTIQLAPENHVFVLAVLASTVALATAVVPLFAGWFSDALRRRGGSRRAFVGAGVAIDVGALAALSYVHTLAWFAVLLIVATLGANVALSAYQVLLPESVPRRNWGVVSGVRGASTLVGSVLGFAIAGSMPNPSLSFMATAIVMAAGGLTLLGIGEGTYDGEEHARVRDWHDFVIVFVARVLVFFGLTMLQTFVLFFFRDVQKIGNPSAGTALYAFCTIAGAVISSLYLGLLSDRVPRKIVTALAIALMSTATIGFALAPVLAWMLPFALLFGIGFGGVMSSGWALAMDAIPKMRDVGRDLGLWGIATSLPNIAAPLVGGWLIGLFGGTRAGYQAVFGLSGFSFALAALSVLRVGRRPLSSLWGWPLRFAAVTSNYVWDHLAYRVRSWGRLPRRRGPTLIVANHQHDFESPAIVSSTTVESGSWRHPIFTASSRRMYEPGFFADRLPWLRFALRGVNAGPLFMTLGLLPLENELGARALAAFAWAVHRRHGPLSIGEIFDDSVASRFPPETKSGDLWRSEFFDRARAVVKVSTVREPYRREILDETRDNLEKDLALLEDVVRRGGTFYLTPEGHYSYDGRLRPMRGAVHRLAPLATIYLVGVSYDPFVSRRLSMLYRVVP
ncbi:MAG: MFS transporter, partial [Candidatus Cybelea sp.]